jgi:hypothetical protein
VHAQHPFAELLIKAQIGQDAGEAGVSGEPRDLLGARDVDDAGETSGAFDLEAVIEDLDAGVVPHGP